MKAKKGQKLKNATIKNQNLNFFDFSNCSFGNVGFLDCRLNGSSFAKAHLNKAYFSDTQIVNINWVACATIDCTFEMCLVDHNDIFLHGLVEENTLVDIEAHIDMFKYMLRRDYLEFVTAYYVYDIAIEDTIMKLSISKRHPEGWRYYTYGYELIRFV